MAEQRVVLEIQVDADTPLEAAKIVQQMMDDGCEWQFYVQQEKTKTIHSVDLSFEEEEATEEVVTEVLNYKPLIEL